MKKNKNILIDINSSIKDAIEKLESFQSKVLICVDKKTKLVGTISDGDIRRAFLKGAKIFNKLKKFAQLNPTSISIHSSKRDAYELMSKRVMVLPVIDLSKKVVGYYTKYDSDEIIYNETRDKNVVVIGLGYVGLTLSCILADSGFKVYGYDNNPLVIKGLKKKKSHFYERGIQKYLDEHIDKNINLIDKLDKSYGSTYIISVGTNLKLNSKTPNLDPLKQATKKVSRVLKNDDLIIYRSTIPIGCSRKILIPKIENITKLKCGKDFYFSFAPERTAEGVALKELKENPQIIGTLDDISYKKTSNFFNKFTNSTVNVETIEAAEFSKLLDNSFRDHMFAFSNQFIEYAEKININFPKLIDKINHGYKRNNIPKPSPGVGGPCLTKDPFILNYCLKETGIKNTLQTRVREINMNGPKNLLKRIKMLIKKNNKSIDTAKIFLIGLAFKGNPETSDLRDSTSIQFLELFKNKKNIYGFDYRVTNEEIKKLGIKPVSLEQGFKNSDIVIFLNNHKSYSDLNISKLSKSMKKPAVIFDCWQVFEPSEIKKLEGILYGGLAVG